ncbi:MAG: hypothetical protein K2N85_02695 [Lachnospiraceae bacterium]|nr:hypothetical protein [Lachnospiraceae bacterium]
MTNNTNTVNITIEEFGNKICKALKESMGAGYDAAYKEVTKNNGVYLHAIMINKKGSNVSPAIYIDELYGDYEEGRSFGDIVYDILCVYQRNAREIRMDMEFFTHFERVKDRVLYKLIHKESNINLLTDVPYIEWNDLALVFYYSFEDERFGKATILIRNSHLNMWKISQSVLYENAKNNMLRLRPEEMLPIKQIISEILTQNSVAYTVSEHEPEVAMYVLSNRERLYGAAVLLYAESLKELAGKLNKNLIILPSSVHEVLLVPDDGLTEKDFFRQMVKEVNDNQVEPEERLSYNVYHYDRVLEKITIL